MRTSENKVSSKNKRADKHRGALAFKTEKIKGSFQSFAKRFKSVWCASFSVKTLSTLEFSNLELNAASTEM